MRRRLTWVTFAGTRRRPMGMQRYEIEVFDAIRRADAPTDLGERWDFEQLEVAPYRHATGTEIAVPMRLLNSLPYRAARQFGRRAYGAAQLVHRLDLRLPPPSVPEVVTVHDLPPVRFSDEGQLSRAALKSAAKARLVICPSRFAAEEVQQVTGAHRVAVAPNGVAPIFAAVAGPSARQVDGPYVLHVGGATARKNLGALAGAWTIAHHEFPDVKLVLVGPDDRRRDDAFAGRPNVLKLGYRQPEEIAALMRDAHLVVVPSVYEGFGLPALEAMASGTAVVASRRGALPEVCGDAALLSEPDPEALATCIVKLLADDAQRAALETRGLVRAADFTWERSAAAHLRAYDEAFSNA